MKIFIITKYSYYTIIIVAILMLSASFYFLYNNFYQTLIQAKIIYVLKSQVAFESVNIELWDKVAQNLENKKISILSTEKKLNNPFVEFVKVEEE